MASAPSAPPSAQPAGSSSAAPPRRIALLGNPNTGKTTLFNRLCGVRSKTANFPGSTVESRVGTASLGGVTADVIDLPGIYSLSLSLPESRICSDCLEGRIGDLMPDAAILVVDANNLSRNLQFAASALRRHLPFVVAVNMVDLAVRRGLSIDAAELSAHLGCPVVCVSARTGEGVEELLAKAAGAADAGYTAELGASRLAHLPAGDADSALVAAWAAEVVAESVGGPHAVGHADDTLRDRLDAAFTHPVLGVITFMITMGILFATIFWVARFPMDGLQWATDSLADLVRSAMPSGQLRDLLSDGIIKGVGITLVFFPQILLLFFLITLMEDSGYLARAAFAVDRVMCRFGLPGQAFVPLLSSHACALPGILSTRLIPDRRDRLATILVAPFMSCSARLQVYSLVISLLFADRPVVAALAFLGCYVTGALAGLLTALLARRTLLRGRSRPMVLELPAYRLPSLRTALLTTWDRGVMFLRNAGTVILSISVVMWWLSAYPRAADTPEVTALRDSAAQLEKAGKAEEGKAAAEEANLLQHRHQQISSFAGQLGGVFEPIFRPLGFDRQLTVGVLTSFLAREVFSSTMAVLAGASADEDESAHQELVRKVGAMTRDDGAPLFTTATCASVLVFFVLAMQCLPTMALVKRETGRWSWVLIQFVWMSGVAWLAAFATYHGLHACGIS